MDSSDRINSSFTQAYNKIHNAYDAASEEDEIVLNQCIAQARSLLEEPSIPRYHRIKTLLLLTSMVGNRSEAQYFHRQADNLYRLVRAHEAPGANPKVDKALAELSESLEELRVALAEEVSAADADEVAAAIAADKKEAAEAEREAKEADWADAKALGYEATDEGVRKMKEFSASKAAPTVLRTSCFFPHTANQWHRKTPRRQHQRSSREWSTIGTMSCTKT
jgi:hypothetical protein